MQVRKTPDAIARCRSVGPARSRRPIGAMLRFGRGNADDAATCAVSAGRRRSDETGFVRRSRGAHDPDASRLRPSPLRNDASAARRQDRRGRCGILRADRSVDRGSPGAPTEPSAWAREPHEQGTRESAGRRGRRPGSRPAFPADSGLGHDPSDVLQERPGAGLQGCRARDSDLFVAGYCERPLDRRPSAASLPAVHRRTVGAPAAAAHARLAKLAGRQR